MGPGETDRVRGRGPCIAGEKFKINVKAVQGLYRFAEFALRGSDARKLVSYLSRNGRATETGDPR